MEAGLLVPLNWRPGDDMPTLAGEPWESPNPVVFISHGWLQHLPQRLLAVHYGQLFEAKLDQVTRARRGDRPQDLWHRLEPADDDDALACIRRLYTGEVNSAPVCTGERLERLVEHLDAAAPAGYLALHAAPGIASRRTLRLSDMQATLETYRRERVLPVNFELLGLHAAGTGAQTWSHELADGWVVHATLGGIGDSSGLLAGAARRIATDLGDARALAGAMRAAVRERDSSVALALLRSARHDVDVFAAACPALHARVLVRQVHDACAWSDALRAVSAQVLPRPESLPLHRHIALCAARVADWSLALQTWLRVLEVGGPCAHDLAHLAWCRLRTGAAERAAALVQEALALEPENVLARQARQHIEERLAQRDDAWRTVIRSPDADLVLEPLDSLHVDALVHQYRDPQIAVMAGLPALPRGGEPSRWFSTEFINAARMDYAVLHPDRGFIGQVGLDVEEDLATFAFWMGVDFQGRGYAIEAGRALCCFARSRGVRIVFATAYLDNFRSIRALRAIGFRRMPLRSTRGDSARAFLAWAPPDQDAASLVDRLVELLKRKNREIDFEVEVEIEEAPPQASISSGLRSLARRARPRSQLSFSTPLSRD
jgi:RimJ/RimL family protein N-acetyltransferase